MSIRFALVVGILTLVSSLRALAADPPSGAKQGPQTKEFYRIHREMNAILGELAGLQLKYRTVDEDHRDEIQQKWKELSAKEEKLEPQWIEAAQKAYAEAPNADQQITGLLVKVLIREFQRDNYEPAAEIGKLLLDNRFFDKQIANLAGIAAFCVSDFDAAEKYLAMADKSGYYQTASSKDKNAQRGGYYLQNIPDYKKAWQRELRVRRREAEADNLPRVLLKTNKGDIVVELFENEAPNTVANFISLVERGFYKDTPFHRVLAESMAQGGDPKGNGSGGPGYMIPCECNKPNHRLHFRGSLSMAHRGRDTGGSQFFIAFAPSSQWFDVYTVFGRIIKGMDVLAKLQRRNPEDREAPRPDVILDAKVLRKRPHEYKPLKMP
jgi:cyclophilin family peptidyl-prolyl cis-trans isomerase